MKNLNSKETLLGKRIRIRLLPYNKETLEKLRRQLPDMPTIKGVLVKRFLFHSWGYIVQLDNSLLLDKDGMNPEVEKKISTSYLLVYLCNVAGYEGKDLLYLGLMDRENNLEKANMKTSEGEIKVHLRYIKDPGDVPSEISKNDEVFLKNNPFICEGGWLKLID